MSAVHCQTSRTVILHRLILIHKCTLNTISLMLISILNTFHTFRHYATNKFYTFKSQQKPSECTAGNQKH